MGGSSWIKSIINSWPVLRVGPIVNGHRIKMGLFHISYGNRNCLRIRESNDIDTYVASPPILLELLDYLRSVREVHIFNKYNRLQDMLQICKKTRNITWTYLGSRRVPAQTGKNELWNHRVATKTFLPLRYSNFIVLLLLLPEDFI